MVERRFADDLETSAKEADQINRINEEEGVRWLYSFLSADKRKTYCLYEAPFADAIRRAAERAGLPADAVVEVGGMVRPDGSAAGIPDEMPARQPTPLKRAGPGNGSSIQPRDTAIMAAWVRFAAPVLSRMLRTWLDAVFSVMFSRDAISLLLLPPASNRRTAISLGVS